LRREKLKKNKIQRVICGCYLDQITVTLKVAASEGSIAATFVSPLLRREKKNKK
jgi:hypothetical protein